MLIPGKSLRDRGPKGSEGTKGTKRIRGDQRDQRDQRGPKGSEGLKKIDSFWGKLRRSIGGKFSGVIRIIEDK